MLNRSEEIQEDSEKSKEHQRRINQDTLLFHLVDRRQQNSLIDIDDYDSEE